MELEDYGLNSRSDEPLGVSACPQLSFSEKLVTPKGVGGFILASLTNRSHQVNSRILLGPCFKFVVYVETLWPMLNMNLSYKSTSSWRIFFRSGRRPMQLSRLEMFRALVVPGGGCCKGVLLQVILMPMGVLPNGKLCLRRKGDIMGVHAHALGGSLRLDTYPNPA